MHLVIGICFGKESHCKFRAVRAAADYKFSRLSSKNSKLSQPHNVKHTPHVETASTKPWPSGKIINSSPIKTWLAFEVCVLVMIKKKALLQIIYQDSCYI